MTINEIQDQIIEEFSVYDEWLDKYEYLIELGNSLDTIEENKKTPDNIIQGCQSRVWLDAVLEDDNTVTFRADSDAIITKGIIHSLKFEAIFFLRFYPTNPNCFTGRTLRTTSPSICERVTYPISS